MASPTVIQQPILGYNVTPATVTSAGTSSLHGRAAVIAKQKNCSCALIIEHPSNSHLGPQKTQGKQSVPSLNYTYEMDVSY